MKDTLVTINLKSNTLSYGISEAHTALCSHTILEEELPQNVKDALACLREFIEERNTKFRRLEV